MSAVERQRWDEKYAQREVPTHLSPDQWLIDHVAAIPPGRVLDLACGLGHNGIWLAQQGWTVDAVDISPVGLKLAKQFAERLNQKINWIAADVDDWRPQTNAYDLIVVFRFLQRLEVPGRIQTAIRPGGRLIYETFTTEQLGRRDNHIRNPDHTLAAGELPTLFPDFTTIEYREAELKDRTVAQLVAQRRKSVADCP